MKPKTQNVRAWSYKRGMLGPEPCSRVIDKHGRGGQWYTLCRKPTAFGDLCDEHKGEARANDVFDALQGICAFIAFVKKFAPKERCRICVRNSLFGQFFFLRHVRTPECD